MFPVAPIFYYLFSENQPVNLDNANDLVTWILGSMVAIIGFFIVRNLNQQDKKFESIERRCDAIDNKFDGMDRRIDHLEVGQAQIITMLGSRPKR